MNITRIILEMYITLIPVIAAGVLNMVWVKMPYMNYLAKPMDRNRLFRDGNRILGENKTWKGFLGMILLAVLSTIIWGGICAMLPYLNEHNYLYRNNTNTLIYNGVMGFLLGLAYALFELPNSFIKRRIGIIPGKKGKGVKGILFVLIDQTDSIFGCVLVIAMVYKMNFQFYMLYICLGALTHILINMLLYILRLRRNMF